MIKVVNIKALADARIWVRFSDGTEGVRDLTEMLLESGEMIMPLRDPELFEKVFLEYGVPTWPNGFDMDAINLHMEMEAAGELKTPVAAK